MLLAAAQRLFANFWRKTIVTTNRLAVILIDYFLLFFVIILDEQALKLACQALLEVVQSSSKNIELGMV